PVAGRAKRRQHLDDAVVNAVLIEADVGKSLTVERHRAIGRIIAAEQSHKACAQRRADAPGQLVLARDRMMIEPLQRVLDRTGDARLGVRQRSVEVEIDRVHDFNSRSARSDRAKSLSLLRYIGGSRLRPRVTLRSPSPSGASHLKSSCSLFRTGSLAVQRAANDMTR